MYEVLLCLPHTGGVQLQLTKLPNGQQFDQWHTLVIPGTKASKGSLRVIATFKHEVILPLDAYRSLSEVRRRKGFDKITDINGKMIRQID